MPSVSGGSCIPFQNLDSDSVSSRDMCEMYLEAKDSQTVSIFEPNHMACTLDLK